MLEIFTRKFEAFVRRELSGEKVTLENPNLERLNPYSSSHKKRSVKVPRDRRDIKYMNHVASLLSETWIPRCLEGENPSESLRQAIHGSGAGKYAAGHISFLQESGCKARVVAVPNAWIQWIMEPLARYLESIIRSDPNSVVYRQNDGAHFLRKALEAGEDVWCFDLSSATDRFPLPLQEAVLRGMGLTVYADAFHSIAREGRWRFDSITWVSYGAGQPMGMYGSFQLFHLTHVLLIRYLGFTLGIERETLDKSFLVCGDDVLIFHQGLASKYEYTLSILGVEVSDAKTIHSQRLGQFVGFTSINEGRVSTYRPFKWTSEDANLVNVVYAFGRSIKRRGQKWTNWYTELTRTWSFREPDLSPLWDMTPEEERKADYGLDVYFLGSLVNELSYRLPYHLSSEFKDLWLTHRYVLLNKKPPYGTKSDDGVHDTDVTPLATARVATAEVHKPEKRVMTKNDQVVKDPVVSHLRRERMEKLLKEAEEESNASEQGSISTSSADVCEVNPISSEHLPTTSLGGSHLLRKG